MVMRRFPLLRVSLMLAACCAGPAAAQDEPSKREQELEALVRRLADRVEQLEARLGRLEGTRVQELEEKVEQIKEERPPAVDSDEWKEMRKWVTDPNTVRPYWKEGLRFDTADGSFKLRIGGRIQNDWAYFCEDGDIERRLGEDFDDVVYNLGVLENRTQNGLHTRRRLVHPDPDPIAALHACLAKGRADPSRPVDELGEGQRRVVGNDRRLGRRYFGALCY